jgi:formylglycine-generating enzyme required for sulfatase activity
MKRRLASTSPVPSFPWLRFHNNSGSKLGNVLAEKREEVEPPMDAYQREFRIIPIALMAMLFLSLSLDGADAPQDPTSSTEQNPPPLPVLLSVRREPDFDLWISPNGQMHKGRVLNKSLRLQTGHGELEFPTETLAAIDLTRQRTGVDSVVTTAGDRLSGLLLDASFEVQPADSNATVIRRELIDKILFRLLPTAPTPDGPLLILRNGDFVHGQVQPAQLLVRPSAGEPRTVPLDSGATLAFPELPGGLVRIEPILGEPWDGAVTPLDFEIQLAAGLRMTVYSDRVAAIRPWTGLDLRLAKLIGIPATPAGLPDGPTDNILPGLVWIPPGEFDLGSPTDERDRDLDEGPVTRVHILDGFWIAAHEVTQAEYENLLGRNPSQYTGDGLRPVEKINWQEAVDYCQALNIREQALGRLPPGYAFRLPTEAEWEYACRAGSNTRFSHGDDPAYLEIPNFAWCGHNSGSTTHPVGTRRPNPWGLFDMHGNVWEWCLDPWTGTYPGGAITNSVTASQGSLRVARGGSWLYDPRFCRSANRDSYGMLNRCSDVGFRVVLAPIR